jgi:hypothetical protein
LKQLPLDQEILHIVVRNKVKDLPQILCDGCRPPTALVGMVGWKNWILYAISTRVANDAGSFFKMFFYFHSLVYNIGLGVSSSPSSDQLGIGTYCSVSSSQFFRLFLTESFICLLYIQQIEVTFFFCVFSTCVV